MSLEETFIIVGLGNPGSKYNQTRHNIGFDVLNYLERELNLNISKIKFKGLLGEGVWREKRIVLIKPQTFMNLSGECVLEAVKWYKVPLQNLFVVYDDVDIDFGKIRIRQKGSSGTHNGMRSIIFLLKDDQFPRVRVGVGRPKMGEDMAHYVLSRFTKDQQTQLPTIIQHAGDAILWSIQNGVLDAMGRFNGISS